MNHIDKITLIEPEPAGFHVFTQFKMPRLGLPLLGTILKQAGYDVRIHVGPLSKKDFHLLFLLIQLILEFFSKFRSKNLYVHGLIVLAQKIESHTLVYMRFLNIRVDFKNLIKIWQALFIVLHAQ